MIRFNNQNNKIYKILGSIQYDIILALLTSFGSTLTVTFITEMNVPLYVAISIGAVFLTLVIWLIVQKKKMSFVEEQRQKKIQTIETQLAKERLKEQVRIKEESTNLMSKTIEYSTYSLRSISEKWQSIYNESFDNQCNTTQSIESLISKLRSLKPALITSLLRNIRHTFEGNGRSTDTTTYPYNYFKAALFELDKKNGRAFLHRTFYHYPEGVEPHEESEWVDIEKNSRCTHVLAFKNQEMVVLEDIQSEFTKEITEARWMNLWHNQSADYRSMVCIPIVIGKKNTPERQVLAVLAIDTNREGYFLEDKYYRAFLGRLLTPFRTILSIILQIDIWFTTISEYQQSR